MISKKEEREMAGWRQQRSDWAERLQEGEEELDNKAKLHCVKCKRSWPIGTKDTEHICNSPKIVDVPGREPDRRVLLTPTEEKWPDGCSMKGGPGCDTFEGIWWCSKHKKHECTCEEPEKPAAKDDTLLISAGRAGDPVLRHSPDTKIRFTKILLSEPEKPATTKDELISQIKRFVYGCHVMVHSSYKSIRPVEGGPQTVVDAFVEAVGPKGCVLFPTYDFHSFSDLGYWDKQMTTSKMGIISETARLDPRFRRTGHPMLSYAVCQGEDLVRTPPGGSPFRGKALYPYDEDPISHGAGSVFDLFLGYGGVLISIGALEDDNKGFRKDDRGFTISNHAATLAGVPWRKMKKFEGIVANGPSVGEVECWASVTADPLAIRTAVSAAHQLAEDKGIIHKITLGNGKAHIASAQEFVTWAIKSHRDGPDLWKVDLSEEKKA